MIDWSIVSENIPAFANGLLNTLILLALVMIGGFMVSVPLALVRASSARALAGPVWLFTYVVRGTPLLVQLFVIYYGLGQFEIIRNSILWPFLRSPWVCAWAALSINTIAYTTEIFAGAIKATSIGEIEAARAVGLRKMSVLRYVVWPSAWRRALPQYGNEVIMMMHATALASTVTIVEVMRVARDVYTNYLVLAESFGVAAAIYLFLTIALTVLFRRLERYFLRHLDRIQSSEVRSSKLEPEVVQ